MPAYNSTSFTPLTDSLTVDLVTFPIHMCLLVWVEVKNALGTVSSEKLMKPSEVFGKRNVILRCKILRCQTCKSNDALKKLFFFSPSQT